MIEYDSHHLTMHIIMMCQPWPFLCIHGSHFLHVHAIGATEEITVLEYEADPQEERQEVQQQEVLREGKSDGEQLPECPDHQPSTFVKGKPRSILSLLRFWTINLSPFMLMH